jgi:hypothetical protein
MGTPTQPNPELDNGESTYSELGHAVSADGISRVIIHDALAVGGRARRELKKEREREMTKK